MYSLPARTAGRRLHGQKPFRRLLLHAVLADDVTMVCCLQVVTDKGVSGVLEGAFGKSGKFNVRFAGEVQPGDVIVLHFKKFVHGDKGRMVQ